MIVTCEVDSGPETVKLTLPAGVTADLRLNEPRYALLPNIMKVKNKVLATMTPPDLGVDVAPRLKKLHVAVPPVRKAGEKVASVDESSDAKLVIPFRVADRPDGRPLPSCPGVDRQVVRGAV